MTTVAFTVPMRPIGVNHAYAPAIRDGHPGFRMTELGKAYKTAVFASAIRAMRRAPLLTGKLEARLLFVYPDERSDTDGAIKPTLDAMQGAVYRNDRSVRRIVVDYASDPRRPRVEIQVTEITP